jgi:hypothetical protein
MKLWKLALMDETEIEMPHAAAEMVKQAMARGDKFVSLPDRVVAVHQIKSLDKTSREDVSGKKALQAGLNAFKSDVNVQTDKDGYQSVQAIKVKKEVSQREYAAYYAKHPSYETVSGNGSGHWVAFWVAKDLGVPESCVLA